MDKLLSSASKIVICMRIWLFQFFHSERVTQSNCSIITGTQSGPVQADFISEASRDAAAYIAAVFISLHCMEASKGLCSLGFSRATEHQQHVHTHTHNLV